MHIKKKFIPALCIAIFSMFILTGCVYDYLDINSNNGDGIEINEPSLVFDFNVSAFGNGSNGSGAGGTTLDHGEEWENFVDLSNIRVLLCDSLGNYLFEIDRRYVACLSGNNTWSGGTDVYRVVIPRRGLYADVHGEALNAAIKEAVEEKGFKIAVMANWPRVMEGEPLIDPETNNEIIGEETESTELDFVWDPEHKKRNSHISYLTHCMPDYVYGRETVDDDGKAVEPYTHLPYNKNNLESDLGQMGVYKSWVSNTYRSQRQAKDFIRQGLSYAGGNIDGHVEFTYKYKDTGKPETFEYNDYGFMRYVDAENVYYYDNVWRVWNFSAGVTCPYHSDNSAQANDYWQHRNKNVLLYGLGKLEGPGAFVIRNNKKDTIIECKNSSARYVEVKSGNSESGYVTLPNALTSKQYDNILAKGASSTSTDVASFRNSAFLIKAYSEGTLRIRAKGASKNSKIAVLTRIPNKNNSEAVEFVDTLQFINGQYVSKSSGDPYFYPIQRGEAFDQREGYGLGGEFMIQPNSNDYLEVYVGAIDDAVDFYEIEYMRARHLYDVARNAVMPSYKNPIPMYGIQNFGPIGPYLRPEKTFNMSNAAYNDYLPESLRMTYQYKNIYLLRSVAKVELLFDRSVFSAIEPENVFMRVMNRSARCEPTDVLNPTDWVWYGDGGENTYNGRVTKVDKNAGTFVGANAEFENIKHYGPLHNRAMISSDGGNDQVQYRRVTSWFYGIWAANDPSLDETERGKYYWLDPWDWNKDQTHQTIIVPSDYPCPRIFNPRIDRSDFCRFHRVPSTAQYYRFIMYVPEKNIDDADSRGRLSASPKVQHIEIRFKNMNNSQNYDDNNCYRIYFTNYAENGENMNYNRDAWDTAERDADNKLLNMLQPVMRNCHYQFYINSINQKKVGVNFQVCGAASRTGQTFVIK